MMVGSATLISDDYIEMNGLCAKRLLSRKRLWSRNDFFCETTFAERGMAFLCCALGRALFCATGHASVFVFCARVRPSARASDRKGLTREWTPHANLSHLLCSAFSGNVLLFDNGSCQGNEID